MSRSIVAAKDIVQAWEILPAKPGKAMRELAKEEPEEVGRFLYDFRAAFANYATYYRVDPYQDTLLEPDQVPDIRVFVDFALTWLSEHEAKENWAQQLNMSKHRKYIDTLGRCGGNSFVL